MGYLHIPNLYKEQDILLFRRCYALEKIHGTSTHIGWKGTDLNFFSGGENHERFARLFDAEILRDRLTEKFGRDSDVTVFGEGYGGKCQGMSKTYGKEFRFVAFDVQIGDVWLAVPAAAEVVSGLCLEFVHYTEVPTELDALNAERDADSEQAKRNGMGVGLIREGVVLRPLIEVRANNGRRIIAKHKREEFAERATIPDIDPAKREIMAMADAIAEEWVTAMRLSHVLDRLRGEGVNVMEMRATGSVIKAMVEDVTPREAEGEIMDNAHVRKLIGAKAANMFKRLLTSIAN